VSNQKTIKIDIYCLSAKHATLRSKNKDWLAEYQNSVSEWRNMLFQFFS